MRWAAAGALCVTMGIAGCSEKASDEAAPFVAGIAAFKAGDRPALISALESLEPPAEAPAECTSEAMAAARKAAMRRILGPLDNSAVLSMGEEARYLYFIGISGQQVEGVAWPRETCKDKPGGKVLTVDDAMRRAGVMKSWQSAGKDWRDAMSAKYGAELRPRLKAAQRTLRVNHLSPGGYDWQGR